MPFTNGVYAAPSNSWNPAVTGTTINSTDWITLLADITTAFSTCLLKDGSQVVTANIPVGGFKFTGLAAGTTNGDSLRYEQLVGVYLLLAGGTMAGNLLVPDAFLQITGSADATKKVVFEVDGLTTATTRTVTVPDKSGTMAMTSDIVSTTPTLPRLIENVGLSITLAANAVTIALKGTDGNDPSASNIVSVSFRNATVTTGTASKVQVIAALSGVIASGATLGTVSALASRVWIGAILNAGAVELAWFNARGGTAILPTVAPINESGLISTTAAGGGSNSAQTWYSTSARTNVPVTILGYFDSTQTTAGTWAQAITSLNVNPRYRPGDILQVQISQTGAVATGSTVIPSDDTIPQNTEGDQYMTKSITPTSASNVLNARVVANLANGTVNTLEAAIFQDAVANALAAVSQECRAANNLICISFAYAFVAALSVSTTLNVRCGGFGAGTTTFNGYSAGRIYGGVIASSLAIEEICA